jgi:hypothetical protein
MTGLQTNPLLVNLIFPFLLFLLMLTNILGIKYTSALESLRIFEGRVQRIKEEYERVCKAKAALDLAHQPDDRLQPVEEELQDLKGKLFPFFSSTFLLTNK